MQSLWMLVASFLFACMGVCVKLAAETHSAVEITFLPQFHFADSDVRPGSPARGSLATPHWRWQISRGVVGFSALFAYFYAITLLPLATAVTLNYTSAIFLAIYLALAGMRMRFGILGALVVGLVGVVLLLKPTLHADQLIGWPGRPRLRCAGRYGLFQRARTWGTRRAGNAHGVLFFAGLVGAPAFGCLQRIACGRPAQWPAFARCRQLSRRSPN
jgi:drug/metabolite transporter (DMT)-like permease